MSSGRCLFILRVKLDEGCLVALVGCIVVQCGKYCWVSSVPRVDMMGLCCVVIGDDDVRVRACQNPKFNIPANLHLFPPFQFNSQIGARVQQK